MKGSPPKFDNSTIRAVIVALCLCFVAVCALTPRADFQKSPRIVVKERWPW